MRAHTYALACAKILTSWIYEQGAVTGSCDAYADFKQLLSSIPNLRGVENSINLLKNVVFSSALSGLLPLTVSASL